MAALADVHFLFQPSCFSFSPFSQAGCFLSTSIGPADPSRSSPPQPSTRFPSHSPEAPSPSSAHHLFGLSCLVLLCERDMVLKYISLVRLSTCDPPASAFSVLGLQMVPFALKQ